MNDDELIANYITALDYNLLLEAFPETVAYSIHVIIQEGFTTFEEIKDLVASGHETGTFETPSELFDDDKTFFFNVDWPVAVTIQDEDRPIDYTYHNRIFRYRWSQGRLTDIQAQLDLYTTPENFKYNFAKIIFKIVPEAYQIYQAGPKGSDLIDLTADDDFDVEEDLVADDENFDQIDICESELSDDDIKKLFG